MTAPVPPAAARASRVARLTAAEERLRGVVVALVAFQVVTGFGTIPWDAPGATVQLVQLAHAHAGSALVVAGVLYVGVHLLRVFGGAAPAVRRVPKAPLIGAAVALVFLATSQVSMPGTVRLFLDRAFSVAFGLALAWVLAALLGRWRSFARNGFVSGVVLLLAMLVVAVSGLTMQGGLAGERQWRLHRELAVAVFAAAALHVVIARRARRGSAPDADPRAVHRWRQPLTRVTLPVFTVLVACAAGWIEVRQRGLEPPAVDTGLVVAVDAGFHRALPEACVGCHASVSEGWKVSAHAHAAANPLFTALVENLARERGPGAIVACLRCHAPHAPDPALVPLASVLASDGYRAGVHCVSCHHMAADPRAGDGVFAVTPISSRPFVTLGERAGPTAQAVRKSSIFFTEANVLVAARVTTHRESFAASRGAATCGPCHVQTLAPPTEGRLAEVLQDQFTSWQDAREGLHGKTCATCHMPRRVEGEAYLTPDHRFRAASTYVARFAGGEPEERATREFLESGLVDLAASLAPGPEPVLRVSIRSPGRIGHSFPNAPTDLVQVWLAARVEDAAGATLLDVGSDGPDGAPRLGHRFTDSHGATIDDHRLWAVASVADGGRVPALGDLAIDLPLPRATTPGGSPLRLHVAIRYRRADPAVVERLTGARADGLPIVTIAALDGTVEAPVESAGER
ncbi:MAG: hypothetical protein IPK07_20085 [Deltaproteobacteria bacterium]|nr:hypothetical protein [Deltaproteobacteria bacterium]